VREEAEEEGEGEGVEGVVWGCCGRGHGGSEADAWLWLFV
jgi:hypothetical protein